MVRFTETTHPDGSAAHLDAEWRRRADEFIASAEKLDDARYGVSALRLLSWFKDGHTGMYVPRFQAGVWGLRFPLRPQVFADGLYVTSARDEAIPLLGARITRIAGAQTEQLIRRFAEVWPAAGTAWAHRWSVLLLSSPAFLHAFGLASGPPDESVALQGIASDGAHVEAHVRPQLDGARNRVPLSRSLSVLEKHAATESYGQRRDPTEDGRNFVWTPDAGRTLYVSLDQMGPDDFGKPFSVFEHELSRALEDKSARRLVIDLRRNGGGDNMLCEPFRKHLQRSAFNRPGGIFVLISPQTFSAAQNLATRLERETFALFVGEPTGSSPNHCGDARPFDAFVTGMPALVSTLRWMDSSPEDHRTAIMPDLLVPSTFEDHVVGRDAALEAAIAASDDRPFDDVVLAAPWERKSQAARWRPFWVG